MHRRLKIAMLGLRGLGEECSGGIERHVEELSVRMAAQGHDITVFCRARYNQEGNRNYRGVRLVNRPAIYSKHLEAISNTAAIIPSIMSGFDIVHFHATGPSLLSWLPRITRQKVVVTVHGLDFMRAKWKGFASLILKAGAWTAVHCPQATIVVSRTLQKYYLEKEDKKTFWIPNGVTPPAIRPLNKLKRFGIEPDNYILSLGRLVPEKGIHYLIPAFRQLDTNLKLVIAGGGILESNYETSLHTLAGDDERIIFTGPLYGEDKDEAFSNARLFALPSDLEGMPIAMLEAMSYGTPVLSSDIPECTEVFIAADSGTNIAVPFKAGNIKDLSLQLSKMLSDVQLQALGKKAEKHVLSIYPWDKVTEHTLDVYRRISKI